MPNVIKISAKINAMQNINILLFVRSLSFTSLKLCSKARKAYRQSKYQHSKNLTRWIKATGTKNTWKMQTVCKSLFTKGAQMFTICTDACLETLSALVNCSVNDVLSEIGPYNNYAFLPFVKDRKRTKSKMVIFCILLIFALIFMTFGRYLLYRW